MYTGHLRFLFRGMFFCALFIAFLYPAGFLLSLCPNWAKARVPEYPHETALLSQADGKVVYFGDSATMWIVQGDKDSGTLAQIVKETCGSPAVAVGRPAASFELFMSQYTYISKSDIKPSGYIVPVNPRCFSPLWVYRPNWDFTVQRHLLDTGSKNLFLLTRGLGVFKYKHRPWSKSLKGYLNTQIECEGQANKSLGELAVPFKKGEVAEDIVKNRFWISYGISVEDSPRIKEMGKFFKKIKASGAPVLVYITPIDIERIGRLLGKDGIKAVLANLEVIKDMLSEYGVRYIDLSRSLSTEDFEGGARPSEHLKDTGRVFVGERIGSAYKEMIEGKR